MTCSWIVLTFLAELACFDNSQNVKMRLPRCDDTSTFREFPKPRNVSHTLTLFQNPSAFGNSRKVVNRLQSSPVEVRTTFSSALSNPSTSFGCFSQYRVCLPLVS